MGKMNGSLINNLGTILNNNGTINNIAEGGQLGLGPRLPNIDAATPLVFPSVVPVVTHIPTMFYAVDNLPELLTSLITLHTKTIDGIDFGYTVEEGDGYTLTDGQDVKVPTISKRAAISPTMTMQEVQGNLCWTVFNTWMSMLSHPDTGFSKLSSFIGSEDIDPFVFSFFSMDIMFIQFDITMLPKNIIDAVFVTCMWPKSAGNLGIKKEVGTSTTQERSIEFNGILQHNYNTLRAGQIIAEMLGLHKANFDYAVPIATDIDKEISDLGISNEISEIMNDFKAL